MSWTKKLWIGFLIVAIVAFVLYLNIFHKDTTKCIDYDYELGICIEEETKREKYGFP